MRTAPGISVLTLLDECDLPALSAWVGPVIVATARELDPSLLAVERLRELAKRLTDPEATIRDPARCAQLVGMLAPAKARELATRLGVSDDGASLIRAARDRENEKALRSFFGVVEDVRAPALASASTTDASVNYGLFPHQRNAAREVHAKLLTLPRRVVLHMPTGSGKTRTAMHLVCRHLSTMEPSVVVWLAPSMELLEQAAEEFGKAWTSLGNRSLTAIRFWGSHDPDPAQISDGMLVAGFGKLNALSQRDPMVLVRLADRVGLVVVDEAHQAIAPTYQALITTLVSKRPTTALLGLTATPGRTWSDISRDAELSAYFEDQKVSLQVDGHDNPVDYLIEEGYLAKALFRTLDVDAVTAVSQAAADTSSSEDYPEQVLDALGMDIQRNLLILREVEGLIQRHRRIIVFAPTVASARLLAAMLVVRAHESEVVTGETSLAERERIIRRFKSTDAKPMVLCNFGVLTTGFDAPATSAAVIARPTRSLVLYSQMVGRATRGPKAGGNPTAEIVTVVDPGLPGFGSVADAFYNWEDVWNER